MNQTKLDFTFWPFEAYLNVVAPERPAVVLSSDVYEVCARETGEKVNWGSRLTSSAQRAGYVRVDAPDATEWRRGQARARSAYVPSDVPEEDREMRVFVELERRFTLQPK